jgi:hypothetical protein
MKPPGCLKTGKLNTSELELGHIRSYKADLHNKGLKETLLSLDKEAEDQSCNLDMPDDCSLVNQMNKNY